MIEFKVEPVEYAQDLIVTVFGVRVIIGKGDEGITADIWPEHDDGGEAFAGTWVTYQEMGVDPDGE